MLTNLSKAPMVYFGGKRHAAPAVWAALGDPAHYCEPFCGSLAVLLQRPALANRTYYSETVNDADGLLVNAWRGIQLQPDATAEAASWPVSEADLMARHLALVNWREEVQLERLMADPTWCDPQMAGWWIWGISCWIGSGWCSGRGPWAVSPEGRVYKQQPARGREPGVSRQLPHLGDDGKGVNHAGTREPGVSRQLPHLGDDGKGVNHAGTREPGVGQEVAEWTEEDFHPMTMPEVRRWFAFLSARLKHVRILNGDWTRAVTGGATLTIPCRMDKGVCGIFIDPPYSAEQDRAADLYANDDLAVATAVRDWALTRTDDKRYRIVIAGYEGSYAEPLLAAGWREVEWFASGYLRGGMGNTAGSDNHQQGRERLWLSPQCLAEEQAEEPAQLSLWGDEDE